VAAMIVKHVDVGEVGEPDAVRNRPAEADHLGVIVEATHDPPRTRELALEVSSSTPGVPVRALGKEGPRRVDVDSVGVIVELVAHA
jgi:hypothetical protein